MQAWLPVENLVHENQTEYCWVLQKADNAGDSTEFVEFMLGMIRNALYEDRCFKTWDCRALKNSKNGEKRFSLLTL